MRLLIPDETALVLGGGGAKGAYEIGAIAALEEMGIHAGSVYGTSVGALNAAMYAQGNMADAEALWERLTLRDVVSEESIALADAAENLFDHPDKLLDFISRNAQRKGLDTKPLRELMQRVVREDALRASRVHFGLVTTRFPSLSMVEKRLEDMAPGSLHDWLLASASCFPVFPMQAIGEERYIDGGFCDNTPVEMAIRAGARHIIAIDIGKHRSHAQYDRRPNITYIRTAHPLGGLITFDPALSARNRMLGYYDTLRAFGQLRGTQYSFDPLDAQALYSRATDFLIRLTQTEAHLAGGNALTRMDDDATLFSLLEEDLAPGAQEIDYFLRACELCAQIADISPAQVLTFHALRDELHARLPLDKAESMLDSLLGGRIGALLSAPQLDRKLVVSCLYHLLTREGLTSALVMRALSAFPRELLVALTLQAIL